jgi:cell wall-associated NlpC family hydrolase
VAAQAGSAYIPIRPDLTNFHRDIAAELKGLDADALRAGQSIGQNLARGIKQGLGDPLAGPLEESRRRQESQAPRQGDQVAGAFARGFQNRLRAAFSSLPKAQIDADASPAERRIAELRARMEELSRKTIGVDVDAGQALGELAAIKAELADIGRNATVDVRADTAAASTELAAVQEQVDRLDGRTARVNVEAGGSGLLALGILSGGLAGIPALGAAAGGLGVLGSGALAAGAGFGGLASVAVPALANIKNALQAETQAQNASGRSAAQSQQRSLALAGAQQQLAAAVRNEAYAHQQALQQVAAAEQQVANAQQSAKDAQLALTEARKSAQRQLEDMTNQVADAQLAVRQSTFGLADAQSAYNKVLANPASTADQKARAKLALDQARQQLTEQQQALKRLQADQAAADKAGVDGANQVRTARERLAQANQQVRSSEQALANARANVARTDQQSADQVASARRAVTAATLQGAAANTKLQTALAKLSPAEATLEKQWKSFTTTYKDWAKALEPDVLPVLSDGLSLIGSQLDRANPLIRASSAAFRILESDAKNALAGPFWSSFLADVTVAAPQAILGLGRIAGHTFEGIAGVVRAFLPYTNDLLSSVDRLAVRFDQWGQNLGSSSGFGQFMAAIRQEGPVIASDLKSIADAAFQIAKAVYPLGQLELQVIGPFASGVADLAKSAPGLVQLAVGFYAVSKANQALGITGAIAGFRGLAVAEGVAGTGAVGAATKLRTLGIALSGVSVESATTKDALLGLGRAGLVLGGLTAGSFGVAKLQDSLLGTTQDTSKLTEALITLGQSGKFTGALSSEFKAGMLGMDTSVNKFRQDAKELVDPSVLEYFNHGMSAAFANTIGAIGGVKSDVTELHDKFINLDNTLKTMAQNGQASQASAAFKALSDQLLQAGIHTDQINKLFPSYTAYVGNATVKNQLFTQAVQAQNQALSQNAHNFQDEQNEIIGFQQQLAYATGLVNTNGRAFWGNSAAALANRQALIQAAGTVQTYADGLIRNNQVTDANITRLKQQRDQLIVLAEKFGLSHDAAQKYVDQLLKIPSKASTSITVGATGTFKMSDSLSNILKILISGLHLAPGQAAGGLLSGPGGPRSDNLLTPTSPGEFVVNAPATSRHLPWLMAINDEGNKGSGYKGNGYAGGGIIGRAAHLAVTMGYAAGGIVPTSYNSSYTYKQSAADAVIDKARRANQQSLANLATFAFTRAVLDLSAVNNAFQLFTQGGTGDGAKAVAYEKAQLGKPYVWGATGPNSFDCSGLTWRAWQQAGRDIGRTTYEQINAGRAGTRAQALPGDLHLPHQGHVMMFINPRTGGDQEMIHAPHTGDHVRYAPFRGGGWVRLIANAAAAPPIGGSGQGPQVAQTFAQAHLAEFGWGQDQFPPLLSLWNRESGWRWNATNPSSGAYGIPQSLPANKMASAGADWRTNAYTQVRWGLGYIQDRYGSPQQAMRHETNVGWYDDGGWLMPGLNMALNATGKPEPVLTGSQWDALVSGTSGGGSAPAEYHAHFDGASSAALQTTVRAAFHSMEVETAMRERVGRRS